MPALCKAGTGLAAARGVAEATQHRAQVWHSSRAGCRSSSPPASAIALLPHPLCVPLGPGAPQRPGPPEGGFPSSQGPVTKVSSGSAGAGVSACQEGRVHRDSRAGTERVVSVFQTSPGHVFNVLFKSLRTVASEHCQEENIHGAVGQSLHTGLFAHPVHVPPGASCPQRPRASQQPCVTSV